MSKMKGNMETNQISGCREQNIGNRILILVKHGNKPFISEEQGNR